LLTPLLLEQISGASIAETCKRSSKVVLHILRSILLPARLLQHLVMPGISYHQQEEEEGGEVEVRRRSIELLDCMLHSADELLRSLSATEGGGGLRAVLLKELRFLLRSERLPSAELLLGLWRGEMRGPGPPTMAGQLLRILRFVAATVGQQQQQQQLNVSLPMADIEQLQQVQQLNGGGGGLRAEAVGALQLEGLLLLTDLVKRSEQKLQEGEEEEGDEASRNVPGGEASFLLLRDSLTEDTFRILLANILEEEEEDKATQRQRIEASDEEKEEENSSSAARRQRREASREVLRVVMRQSGASLPDDGGGLDLQLVLVLLPRLLQQQQRPHLLAQLARAMHR